MVYKNTPQGPFNLGPHKDRNTRTHAHVRVCLYILFTYRLQYQSLSFWNCTHTFSLLQQYSQNYAAHCTTQTAGSRCTCGCILKRADKSISAAFWGSQVCLKNIYVSPLVRALGNLLWSSRATEHSVSVMSLRAQCLVMFPVNAPEIILSC